MPARSSRLAVLLLLGAGVLLAAAPAGARSGGEHCESLTVLEGRVISLGEATGEGDLPLVTVRLEGSEREMLLAPAALLEELEFPVEEGDLLRLRVLGSEEPGLAKVHRVLNLTRSRMLRLRTMQQAPLWDGAGRWQGSPGGHRDGHGGGRQHRGGGSHGGGGGRGGGG
jgi:hypothetical protein